MPYVNYSKKVIEDYEQSAENFFKKTNLEPGFDIIKLLNNYGIEVIPVESLPYNWEYAFNSDTNNLKIYYLKSLLPSLRKYASTSDKEKYLRSLEFSKKELRFVLAEALADIVAFYKMNPANLDLVKHDNTIYCHGKDPRKFSRLKQEEIEYFSACLLMPRDVLTKEFDKLGTNDKISQEELNNLGDKFDVNHNAIRLRCRKIGLI